MICLLVYDITHDGTRSKVSDACLDYGLLRIQYSAFLGDLSRTHQEELFRKVRKRLGKKEGNIQLFPMCEKDVRQRLEVSNVPDLFGKQRLVLSRARSPAQNPVPNTRHPAANNQSGEQK